MSVTVTHLKRWVLLKKKKKREKEDEAACVLQEPAFHSVTPAVKRCNEADLVLLLLFVARLHVATVAV